MSGTDSVLHGDGDSSSGSARRDGSEGTSDPARAVSEASTQGVEHQGPDDRAALYEAIKARVEAGELVPLPLQDMKDPIVREDVRETVFYWNRWTERSWKVILVPSGRPIARMFRLTNRFLRQIVIRSGSVSIGIFTSELFLCYDLMTQTKCVIVSKVLDLYHCVF